MPKANNAHVMEQANRGVQMLLAGAYHEAVNTLTGVLSEVEVMLSRCGNDGTSADPRMQQGPASFCRFLHPECAMNDGLFVCRSPIIVNREHAKLTVHGLAKLCYIVLYNLALTYHLGALSAKSSTGVFCKALGCYQMAHDLQPSDDLELGVQLSLAIANNIGHIHAALGNEEKSGQCFQHLFSTITYAVVCGGSSMPNLIDGFMRNVQLFVMKSRTASAA